MKVFIIILIILGSVQFNADARILFNGAIQVENSSYRSGNLTVNFKDVNTGQSYNTRTSATSGNYSIQIFKGVYNVSVTDVSSRVIFKGIMNVPSSNGLIKINPTYKVSGKLHIPNYFKEYKEYQLIIKASQGLDLVVSTSSINNFGNFSTTLTKGKYEFLIKKNGVLVNSQVVDIKKNQNIDFDLSSPVQEEEKIMADEIKPNQKAKTSVASINFSFLATIIISIVSLIVIYFSRQFNKNNYTALKQFVLKYKKAYLSN